MPSKTKVAPPISGDHTTCTISQTAPPKSLLLMHLILLQGNIAQPIHYQGECQAQGNVPKQGAEPCTSVF